MVELKIVSTNSSSQEVNFITEVIEGGQRTWNQQKTMIIGGVDYLAKQWALRNSIPYRTIKAKWGMYGRSAGPIRNREMAKSGNQLIAIPDAESVGTLDMIQAAREAGFTDAQIYVHLPQH